MAVAARKGVAWVLAFRVEGEKCPIVGHGDAGPIGRAKHTNPTMQ